MTRGVGWSLLFWASSGIASAQSAAPAPTPVLTTGVVHWRRVDLPLEFSISGPSALLSARLLDGTVAPLRAVSRVGDAIAVLADQRLAFAWPALLAWVGADLGGLRDRVLARADVAAATGLAVTAPQGTSEEYAGSADVLLTLQLSSALWSAGRRDEALALLRRKIAMLPGRPSRDDGGYTEVAFGDRLAGWQFDTGDVTGALATLDALRSDPRIEPTYRINADVNTALALARAGRAGEALALVDRTLAAFRADNGERDAEEVKIPDSEAQFAWIKACALAGLGRRANAAAVMAGIIPEADTSPTTGIPSRARISGYLYMHDASALAANWRGNSPTLLRGRKCSRRCSPTTPMHRRTAQRWPRRWPTRA